MKMKKIVLLFSMIAVFFCLTACSDGQGTVDFQYDDTSIISTSVTLSYNLMNIDDATRAYIEAEGEEVYQTGLSNFDTLKDECGTFEGFRSKSDGSSIMIDLTNLDTSTEEGQMQLLTFLSQIDATVEEDGENVTVTLKAVYSERDVELSFVYEKDPAYAYGGSQTSYKPKEITVNPEYTTGEKMTKAASNTLMGMGTVFCVLIFISVIISQFKHISTISDKINNRKTAAQETSTQTSAAPAAVQTTAANPMDDKQLVAVITAAVTAASVAGGGSDKLIVRSIRKARR